MGLFRAAREAFRVLHFWHCFVRTVCNNTTLELLHHTADAVWDPGLQEFELKFDTFGPYDDDDDEEWLRSKVGSSNKRFEQAWIPAGYSTTRRTDSWDEFRRGSGQTQQNEGSSTLEVVRTTSKKSRSSTAKRKHHAGRRKHHDKNGETRRRGRHKHKVRAGQHERKKAKKSQPLVVPAVDGGAAATESSGLHQEDGGANGLQAPTPSSKDKDVGEGRTEEGDTRVIDEAKDTRTQGDLQAPAQEVRANATRKGEDVAPESLEKTDQNHGGEVPEPKSSAETHNRNDKRGVNTHKGTGERPTISAFVDDHEQNTRNSTGMSAQPSTKNKNYGRALRRRRNRKRRVSGRVVGTRRSADRSTEDPFEFLQTRADEKRGKLKGGSTSPTAVPSAGLKKLREDRHDVREEPASSLREDDGTTKKSTNSDFLQTSSTEKPTASRQSYKEEFLAPPVQEDRTPVAKEPIETRVEKDELRAHEDDLPRAQEGGQAESRKVDEPECSFLSSCSGSGGDPAPPPRQSPPAPRTGAPTSPPPGAQASSAGAPPPQQQTTRINLILPPPPRS
ncbi:unnamed protein product, partial [Amoebophrya sp. A120]|eukprot:GSA120T00006280001.1